MARVHLKRQLTFATLIVLLFSAPCAPQQHDAEGHDVITVLNQAIQWYRQITNDQQLAGESSDVVYLNNVRQIGLEVLRNCFDAARAIVALRPAANAPQPASGGENQSGVNQQALAERAAQAENEVKQSQDELDKLEQQLQSAGGKKRQTITAQIAETRSELDLEKARRDTLNGFMEFLASSASGSHKGLPAQIDELEHTVPELRAAMTAAESKKAGATTSVPTPAPPATPAPQRKPEVSGLIGMIGETFGFNVKLRAQKEAFDSTAALSESIKKLREPLVQEFKATSQLGESLTEAPDLTDPAAVQQRTQQIAALTARFKQDSAAVVPLGKSLVLLDSVRATLSEWRNDTGIAYGQALKRLILRLAILAIAIGVVIGASELWRSATLRYVQDTRRRNQVMLLRRIVVSMAIFFIILFMLVTEVGSIATFAGFITAGLAVALQTVILSVVAYFLLIGKWGIRVGDRVCISGVTGDVIDIGLIRMHLMEVDGAGGEEQPTGRVVVFSNAVLFQPTANFFKQIPGTSFTWHRITMTLAPDTDYRHAEHLLMDAVNGVFDDYRDIIQRQHSTMQQTLTIPVRAPQPQSRFRFRDAGLELVIRYPVPLENSSSVDDRVTRALVQALRGEPSLQLVKQGTPAIQAVAETPHMDKAMS